MKVKVDMGLQEWSDREGVEELELMNWVMGGEYRPGFIYRFLCFPIP